MKPRRRSSRRSESSLRPAPFLIAARASARSWRWPSVSPPAPSPRRAATRPRATRALIRASPRPTACRSTASTSRSGRARSIGPALREAGTKFAFIKATEGGDHVDNRFVENWAGAKQRRRPARRLSLRLSGAARPTSRPPGSSSNVPHDPDALPPVLDVEWNGESVNCPKKVPREQALAMINLMLQRDGSPYRQAADHLHRHHLPPGHPGRRVQRLSLLDPQHRGRAARALQRPPLDLLAVHHHRPRSRRRRATSTATPSTAPKTSGACSSPAIATPATTPG